MKPRPLIGELRQRVIIEAPVDAPDDIGGLIRNYTQLTQAWAKIEALASSERFVEQRLEQSRRFTVTLRWRGDVTSQMRILFRGQILLIRSVEEQDATRRFLTCLCEEIS
jgi:SPP1 family predicted phage head-tail adaptor